jgi:hypothetical protein
LSQINLAKPLISTLLIADAVKFNRERAAIRTPALRVLFVMT